MLTINSDIATPTTREATDDETILAIGKSLTDTRLRKIRNSIEPATVEVDAVVSVQGQLVVHEDYEQTQVNKACPWTMLQVAWNKLNTQTRNACVAEVQAMLRGATPKPDLTELKAITKAAVQAVKTDVKQTSKGQVKFNGTIWVAE